MAGESMIAGARSKLLLIGIDAADIEFVRDSLDRLPRFRQLLSDGDIRNLHTAAAETLSSSVWPSFATGLPPGEHGIYYPMQWDAGAMRLRRLSADWAGYDPFWYELARQGRNVTVFDVPFQLQARLEGGVEIYNWGSQEQLGPVMSNRPELAADIARWVGARHPMGEDIPVEQPPAKMARMRRAIVEGARRKAEFVRGLMKGTDWDLFVTVFGEPHRAGHVLWPDVLEAYQALDAAVGHVLDGRDPGTTAVVFSLHGMKRNGTQEHFLPAVMQRINATFGADGKPAELAVSKANPMRLLRQMLPSGLQQAVAGFAPAAVRDWVVQRSFCGGLDWSTTPAFVLPGSGEGYLRLNVAGREAQGMLPPSGAMTESYKNWLSESLLGLRDGVSERPVVREVVFATEVYAGARSQLLPDAVVVWEDCPPAEHLVSERLGSFHARLTTGRTGEHRPEGFAVILGEGAKGGGPPLRTITDFAPWVRHWYTRTAAV